MADDKKELVHCDFCGSNNEEVNVIVKSENACICDQCVTVASHFVGAWMVKNKYGEDVPSCATSD